MQLVQHLTLPGSSARKAALARALLIANAPTFTHGKERGEEKREKKPPAKTVRRQKGSIHF